MGVLNGNTLNAASRLYIEPVFYETPYTEKAMWQLYEYW